MMNRQAWLVATLIALLPIPSLAQRENPMNAVIKSYEQGYYQEVISIAGKALEDTIGLSPEDIIYYRTYLAFSLVAMGEDESAKVYFKQMLAARPKLELNPEFVSPKIIEVFKRAQIEYLKASATAGQTTNFMFEKGRPNKFQGAWRSSLWPGWGQSVRGDPKKGRVLKLGAVGITAGTAAVMLGTYITHQRYLDAVDPGDIEDKYNSYNRWYKVRNFSINLAVSFWAYNVFDIIISN